MIIILKNTVFLLDKQLNQWHLCLHIIQVTYMLMILHRIIFYLPLSWLIKQLIALFLISDSFGHTEWIEWSKAIDWNSYNTYRCIWVLNGCFKRCFLANWGPVARLFYSYNDLNKMRARAQLTAPFILLT